MDVVLDRGLVAAGTLLQADKGLKGIAVDLGVKQHAQQSTSMSDSRVAGVAKEINSTL
jgi:hypothetical protein